MSADGLIAWPSADRQVSDIPLYGALFAAAVAAFCLAQAMGHRFGAASEVVAVLGDATCGWSWLLVRALFQRPSPTRSARERWPLMLVLTLVGAGFGVAVIPAGMAGLAGGGVRLVSLADEDATAAAAILLPRQPSPLAARFAEICRATWAAGEARTPDVGNP